MWLFWLFAIIVLTFGFVVFFGAPYVPSKRRELEAAFTKLYPIGKGDVLVDIGSGDGVVLRAAARKGARAIGLELNPILVGVSQFLSREEADVQVRVANFWVTSLPQETTVVYIFAVSRDMKRLGNKLQKEVDKLRRPLKVITFGCVLPDKKAIKQVGAHHLYDFTPLQGQKT